MTFDALKLIPLLKDIYSGKATSQGLDNKGKGQGLSFQKGTLLNALLVEKGEEYSIIRLGQYLLKATGNIDARIGENLILRCEDPGPPPVLKLLSHHEMAHEKEMEPEGMYLRLKALFFKESPLEEALRQKNFVLKAPDTSAKDIEETIIKRALYQVASSSPGHADNTSAMAQLVQHLGEISTLESLLLKDLGLHVLLIPVVFEDGTGRGLLAVYWERDRGGDKDQKDGRPRSALHVDLDLDMDRLGPVRINAFIQDRNVSLAIRGTKDALPAIRHGIPFLLDRLTKLGFSLKVRGVMDIRMRASEEGFFDTLFKRAQGTVDLKL